MSLSRFLLSLLPSLLVISQISGCNLPSGTDLATPLPAAYLPTAIALTLDAGGVGVGVSSPSASVILSPTTNGLGATLESSPTSIETSAATETATATGMTTTSTTPTITITSTLYPETTSPPPSTPQTSNSTATPFQITLPSPPIDKPPPEIPEARIQIYRLGELSLVTSPIQVTANLTSQVGKVVRLELFGEDGRLLARHVRTYSAIPWKSAKIGVNLEFEISAAAEVGRLVISVEDTFGRLIDVNSVNLILLSTGLTELNPASALWQRIIIIEPAPKALILGNALIVSGRARPDFDQPLKVMLFAEDGRILGQRLAGVSISIPGDYGTFAAEVPYSVSEIIPALLVVLEDGGQISAITHLASLEVILTP